MEIKHNSPVILKSARKLSEVNEIWLYLRNSGESINSSTAGNIFSKYKPKNESIIRKEGGNFRIPYDTIGFDCIFFPDTQAIEKELVGYCTFDGVLGKQVENYEGDTQIITLTVSSSSDESNITVQATLNNSLADTLKKPYEDTFGRDGVQGKFPGTNEIKGLIEEKKNTGGEKYICHLKKLYQERDKIALLGFGGLKSERKNLVYHFVKKPFFKDSNIFPFSSSVDYPGRQITYFRGKPSLVLWSKTGYYILDFENLSYFGNFKIIKTPTDFPDIVKTGKAKIERVVPGRFILSDGTSICMYRDKIETWQPGSKPLFDELSKSGDYYMIPDAGILDWANIGYLIPGLVPPILTKSTGLTRKIGPWYVYTDISGDLIYSGQTYSVSVGKDSKVHVINDRVLLVKTDKQYTAFTEPPKSGTLYTGKEDYLIKFSAGDKIGNTWLRYFTRGYLTDRVPQDILGSIGGSIYYIRNNKYLNYL